MNLKVVLDKTSEFNQKIKIRFRKPQTSWAFIPAVAVAAAAACPLQLGQDVDLFQYQILNLNHFCFIRCLSPLFYLPISGSLIIQDPHWCIKLKIFPTSSQVNNHTLHWYFCPCGSCKYCMQRCRTQHILARKILVRRYYRQPEAGSREPGLTRKCQVELHAAPLFFFLFLFILFICLFTFSFFGEIEGRRANVKFLSSREEISQPGFEPPTSSLRFGYLSTFIQQFKVISDPMPLL